MRGRAGPSIACVEIKRQAPHAIREAESTLKDAVRLARRVLGSTHPTVVQMENSLQNARAILGARESGREVKIIR